jgi:hypothetical protein
MYNILGESALFEMNPFIEKVIKTFNILNNKS